MGSVRVTTRYSIGALRIRIRFWRIFTILIRNPHNSTGHCLGPYIHRADKSSMMVPLGNRLLSHNGFFKEQVPLTLNPKP